MEILGITSNAAFDQKSNVVYYHQITPASCAATCLCMCVKISPQTIQSNAPKPFSDLNNCMWNDIITYANVHKPSTTPRFEYQMQSATYTMKDILNQLKSYPVIAKINETAEHWIVFVGYTGTGNETTLDPANFICYDPYNFDGDPKNLKYKPDPKEVTFNNVTNYVPPAQDKKFNVKIIQRNPK